MPRKLFTVNAHTLYAGSQSYCVLASDKKDAIKRVFRGEKLTAEGDDQYLVQDPTGRSGAFTRATITAYSDRGCACVIDSGDGPRGVGRLVRRKRRSRP